MNKDHTDAERPDDADRNKKNGGKNVRHRPLQLWLSIICGITLVASGILLFLPARDSVGNIAVDANSNVRAATSGVVIVSMRNVQFDPVNVEISKGGIVEWKNDDLVPHTATSPQFDSKTIDPGQSWRHTFRDAGKFPYVCTFHPQMKGVVIVK